jgi:hypothetical protein
LCGVGSRFWDDPEHHRSAATLGLYCAEKVFAFVKRSPSGAKRRMEANLNGTGEKGAAACLRPALKLPEREQWQ